MPTTPSLSSFLLAVLLIGATAANATPIGDTIDLVFTLPDGTFILGAEDVLITEGTFFAADNGDQSLTIDYSEAGGSSSFFLALRDITPARDMGVGGYSVDFLGLDWLGTPGRLTSVVNDPSRLLDDVAVSGQEAIDVVNAFAASTLSFTDNSIHYEAPFVNFRFGAANLAFTAEHTADVPEPGTLGLLAAGLLGMGWASRKRMNG